MSERYEALAGDDEPDFRALARLRQGLQALDRFSESVSREHGCTASMYYLLLVVKNARPGRPFDIGMVAAQLGVRHPSAAEMVRKADQAGFLALSDDPGDARRSLIQLTPAGHRTVEAVAAAHTAQLRELRPGFVAALQALG